VVAPVDTDIVCPVPITTSPETDPLFPASTIKSSVVDNLVFTNP